MVHQSTAILCMNLTQLQIDLIEDSPSNQEDMGLLNISQQKTPQGRNKNQLEQSQMDEELLWNTVREANLVSQLQANIQVRRNHHLSIDLITEDLNGPTQDLQVGLDPDPTDGQPKDILIREVDITRDHVRNQTHTDGADKVTPELLLEDDMYTQAQPQLIINHWQLYGLFFKPMITIHNQSNSQSNVDVIVTCQKKQPKRSSIFGIYQIVFVNMPNNNNIVIQEINDPQDKYIMIINHLLANFETILQNQSNEIPSLVDVLLFMWVLCNNQSKSSSVRFSCNCLEIVLNSQKSIEPFSSLSQRLNTLFNPSFVLVSPTLEQIMSKNSLNDTGLPTSFKPLISDKMNGFLLSNPSSQRTLEISVESILPLPSSSKTSKVLLSYSQSIGSSLSFHVS